MRNILEEKDGRNFLSVFTILIILCITLGSLVFFQMQVQKIGYDGKKKSYQQYDRYYVMIVGEGEEAFWDSVFEGACEAGRRSGAYVEEFGNNLFAGYSREERMRIAIESEADGIILEASEGEKMTALINEAVGKGIPVITVLSDNMASGRQSFVGINAYNLGQEYGKQLLRLANYDKHRILILSSTNIDSYNRNLILASIQDTIRKEKKPAQVLDVTIKNIESDNDFSTEESVRNIFLDEENVPEILVCLDELSAICAYQAVVDYNMVGKLNIIGYYDSPRLLQAIERNVVNSTITVDTAQMGQYCVEALQEYEQTGYVSEYFTADTYLITIRNVKEYMGEAEDEEE